MTIGKACQGNLKFNLPEIIDDFHSFKCKNRKLGATVTTQQGLAGIGFKSFNTK